MNIVPSVYTLSIGINYSPVSGFPTPTVGNLGPACCNDADLFDKRIKSLFEVTKSVTLRNEQALKTNIQNELVQLKNDANQNSGYSLIFFYYSGHGHYRQDTSADEINDSNDEVIIPYDFLNSDITTAIDDDWIRTNFTSQLSSNVCLFAFMDNCHSGTIFDLKKTYEMKRNFSSPTSYTTLLEQYTNSNYANLNCNVFCISSSLDSQFSSVLPRRVPFSTQLESLNKGGICIIYSQNRYYAGGQDKAFAFSDDEGKTWTTKTFINMSTVNTIATNGLQGDILLIAGPSARYGFSTDGGNTFTFPTISNVPLTPFCSLALSNNRFFVGGSGRLSFRNSSGSWTGHTNYFSTCYGMCFFKNNTKICAVGKGSSIVVQSDITDNGSGQNSSCSICIIDLKDIDNLTLSTYSITRKNNLPYYVSNLFGVTAVGNTALIAVGETISTPKKGIVIISTDEGESWNKCAEFDSFLPTFAHFYNNKCFIGGIGGLAFNTNVGNYYSWTFVTYTGYTFNNMANNLVVGRHPKSKNTLWDLNMDGSLLPHGNSLLTEALFRENPNIWFENLYTNPLQNQLTLFTPQLQTYMDTIDLPMQKALTTSNFSNLTNADKIEKLKYFDQTVVVSASFTDNKLIQEFIDYFDASIRTSSSDDSGLSKGFSSFNQPNTSGGGGGGSGGGSGPRIKFKVPTSVDILQQNFTGLVNFEINKMKYELDSKIDDARQKIQNTVINGIVNGKTIANTSLKTFIDSESSKSLTGLNSFTNVKLSNYVNYIDSTLSTKANKNTVNALDEFVKVMNSAMEFKSTVDDSLLSYTPLETIQRILTVNNKYNLWDEFTTSTSISTNLFNYDYTIFKTTSDDICFVFKNSKKYRIINATGQDLVKNNVYQNGYINLSDNLIIGNNENVVDITDYFTLNRYLPQLPSLGIFTTLTNISSKFNNILYDNFYNFYILATCTESGMNYKRIIKGSDTTKLYRDTFSNLDEGVESINESDNINITKLSTVFASYERKKLFSTTNNIQFLQNSKLIRPSFVDHVFYMNSAGNVLVKDKNGDIKRQLFNPDGSLYENNINTDLFTNPYNSINLYNVGFFINTDNVISDQDYSLLNVY